MTIPGSIGAQADLQITHRLGLVVGLSAETVLRQGFGDTHPTALDADANLLLAFRRWDVYAACSLGDMTRSPSTLLLAGFAHRWGL